MRFPTPSSVGVVRFAENQPAQFTALMRRTLWNIYAWPISILILLGFLFELSTLKPLSALDVALSIPALIALHLHVWDVKFLSSTFWKPYAFAYCAWDLYYNFMDPARIKGGFQSRFVILQLVALPLYVAVFRYAFREWSEKPVQIPV